MVGVVREANLRTRTSRARLRRGREPHWQTLLPGKAHLGFQRWEGSAPGRWIVRQRIDGRYRITALGPADDIEGAGLSFAQAETAARAMIASPAAASSRLTVRQAVEAYVANKQQTGQAGRHLISQTSAHILPGLGDAVVSELTAERLRRWLASIAALPSMRRPSKLLGRQKWGPEARTPEEVRRRQSTVNRVLVTLKAALNHCYDEGLVSNRDAWGRKLKLFPNATAARVRFLSLVEATRLINASASDFRLLVRGALETGCRYGELCALEVADFNPDAGTVNIRRSKSGKPRHIILTPDGVAFFKQIVAGRGGTELVFMRDDGEPWRATNQARPMRDACERAKIKPPISFHGLRHSWASLSVMAGMPLLLVARNLGHSDTKMVERHYGHLAPDYVTEMIRTHAPKFGAFSTGVRPIR